MNEKTLGRLIGYSIGIFTHAISCVFNYYAWIEGNNFCQTVLWMIVPLSLIGLCVNTTGKTMLTKFKSGWFWVFWLISQPFCQWTWFSGSSNASHCYGSVSIMVTLFAFYLAIKEYKQNKTNGSLQ